MGLWVADEGRGLFYPHAGGALCASPLCLCACGNAVVCAQACQARVFAADTGAALGGYPLPPAVRCMCALPGALYCLSGEADSVSLLCPLTGQLRLCARAGCDPRDLALSPCRRMLAAAGGAAGALYIYNSYDLRLLRSFSLPGVVYAARFAGTELLALCAVEDGDIHTCLYHISVRGVVSEVLRTPGLPGALLPLPDGSLLLGALGKLWRLRADGRLMQRFPCGLPARLRLSGDSVLCADPLAGKVWRIPLGGARGRAVYAGDTPADVLEV